MAVAHSFAAGSVPICNFIALRRRAQEAGPKQVAVVLPDDVALSAVATATRLGIARPVLVGDEFQVRALLARSGEAPLADRARLVHASDPLLAVRAAIALARSGEADVLMKGHLRTDELLHAVLDRQQGLRTGRLLSDIIFYEDQLSGSKRLVGVTDGGINVLPTLEQKKQILANAIEVMHALGYARPRVAVMSATEMVSDSLPSTLEAHALTQMAAEFGECEVFGPLALDNALLPAAAEAKGIRSPVAGRADVLLMPNIEAGNVLGKAVKYLGGSQVGHVVVGASVPILIPSRVESPDDKLNSIALGVLLHGA